MPSGGHTQRLKSDNANRSATSQVQALVPADRVKEVSSPVNPLYSTWKQTGRWTGPADVSALLPKKSKEEQRRAKEEQKKSREEKRKKRQ